MVAALGLSLLISCLTRSVLPQGPAQLIFNSNPVCSGEDVTLAFTYASGLTLLRATVDAFNGTLRKGFLFYQATPINSTGVGVFAGKNLNGWPNIPSFATNVSVTLTATPAIELDYNSSIFAFDIPNSRLLTLTSVPARLLVYVPPSPPRFLLSPIIFNDNDSGIIICASPDGKPAAAVLITLNTTSGEKFNSEIGNDSASVTLSSWPRPLSKWHNALATCRVTNKNCSTSSISNSSVSSYILINHITITSLPDVIYINESVALNCSAYISYFPGVQYNWTIPPTADVTGNLYAESITVLVGKTGSFYCTAANNVTMASVVIVFNVSNSSRPNTPANNDNLGNAGCELCWIIGLVLGIIAIVVIAVVICVRCKHGHFSKGRKSTSGSEMHYPNACAADRSNTTKQLSVDGEYDSLDIQRNSEPTYSELVLEQNPSNTSFYENFKSPKR